MDFITGLIFALCISCIVAQICSKICNNTNQ